MYEIIPLKSLRKCYAFPQFYKVGYLQDLLYIRKKKLSKSARLFLFHLIAYRFCSQEFTLEKFDVQVHLSNNSIQKHFQNGARSSKLPESNMWSSDEFKLYLDSIGKSYI